MSQQIFKVEEEYRPVETISIVLNFSENGAFKGILY
jgi:hypothetical protein